MKKWFKSTQKEVLIAAGVMLLVTSGTTYAISLVSPFMAVVFFVASSLGIVKTIDEIG